MNKEDFEFEIILDKLFCDFYGKNQLILQKYKEIYDIKVISKEYEVSEKLFECIIKKDFFAILLLYDSEGKIYLDRNVSDTLYWGLPGKSIKCTDTVYNTVNEISQKINKAIIIGDVEPLVIIDNIFLNNGNKHIHSGIAFAARVRNSNEIKEMDLQGNFVEVNDKELNYIKKFSNKKIVEIFLERYNIIKSLEIENFQENEIATNEKYKSRYEFHNNFVKKFILTKKRKKKVQFQKIIEDMLDNSKSIIDVSCGEDKFIFEMCEKNNINLVVGNDISWSQVEFMNKLFPKVIFTNHNATCMPFKDNAFNISYCSNTLHHMLNRSALISLLNNMYRISEKIIIVEIENPQKTGGIPMWLNKNWFIGFLKDVGGAYLTLEEFKIIINKLFSNKSQIRYKEFRNIIGNYMIAEIKKGE